MPEPTLTTMIVSSLLDDPHTWDCPNGHRSVTWEKPPPTVGDRRTCGDCFHPADDGVQVVSVAAGLPLAKVRYCLGRDVAAGVLAAGGAA